MAKDMLREKKKAPMIGAFSPYNIPPKGAGLL
jgi:hypothetical protein